MKTIKFFLFLAAGSSIFLFGGYLNSIPEEWRSAIKVANVLVFGAAAILFARNRRVKPYFPVAFAFFLAAAGLLLAWMVRQVPQAWIMVEMDTPRGWAIAKVAEALPMVLPALVLLPALGKPYSQVYLQRGRLALSLGLGLGLAGLVGLVYGLTSDVIPKAASMVPVLGWVIVFSLSNAFMEELLLRGVLLRPFEQHFSRTGALLLSTLIFTAMHFGASYLSSDNLWFLLGFIFLLGFGCGAIIQRSESLWGSVLAHAFADTLLLASIFGTVG